MASIVAVILTIPIANISPNGRTSFLIGDLLVNPYEPPEKAVLVPQRAALKWKRWFVVLNGVLVAIPALMVLIAYISVQIEMYIANYSQADLVTFDSELSYEGPAWMPFVYFLVPNVLFAVGLVVVVNGRRANDDLRKEESL